ncbi:MAG TPA: transglutaminase-like domain-containing protein [Chitinophagaceae bacterium]|nr:transglutaminase-like domain-containing protein [Chitinophagaceae bacterium]
MRTVICIVLVVTAACCYAQPEQRNKQLQKIDTLHLNLKMFADSITGHERDEYEKARKLLYWLSSNFEWKATDYKTRTVNEIIARNGGNCFELAKVYMALIKEAGITHRGVAEINIHPYTPRRQASAAELVKQKGNSFSVFGLQHNDHRWVEIYDKKNNLWQPADPSMGVIGLNDWLKARVWFGERKTIDTAITNSMIVPFVIFSTDAKRAPDENRTAYYLIEGFNNLYQGKLETLPEWKEWVNAVNALTGPAKNAFTGKENLHDHQASISKLADTYQQLKSAYNRKYGQRG